VTHWQQFSAVKKTSSECCVEKNGYLFNNPKKIPTHIHFVVQTHSF